MRPIASFSDLPTLEASFTEWYAQYIHSGLTEHGNKVVAEIPREQISWRPAMMECADAFTWANSLLPDLDDFEVQALGILTADMTLAEARGKAHRIIRVHKAVKRLADSADRKLSALQTINKM